MLVRLAFLKRGKVGDGIEVDHALDIDHLPRVGEWVFLPMHFAEKIAEFDKEGFAVTIPARRFEVVHVEHKWDTIVEPTTCVYISRLNPQPPS